MWSKPCIAKSYVLFNNTNNDISLNSKYIPTRNFFNTSIILIEGIYKLPYNNQLFFKYYQMWQSQMNNNIDSMAFFVSKLNGMLY